MLSLRDFQDDKADVIVKYTPDEARACTHHCVPDLLRIPFSLFKFPVQKYSELPEDAKFNEEGLSDREGGDVHFEIADVDQI